MKASISFIYGFPQENNEDINQTLLIMQKIKEKAYTIQKNRNFVDVFLSMLMFFLKYRNYIELL